MCQPGRPGPIGVSQKCSPGFGRLPQRKIARALLFVAVLVDARTGLNSATVNLRELAVFGKLRDAVIDRAFAGVGERLFLQPLDQLHHVVEYGRWRGSSAPALRRSSALQSAKNACAYFSVYSRMLTPAAAAFAMMRSSTSVRFIDVVQFRSRVASG